MNNLENYTSDSSGKNQDILFWDTIGITSNSIGSILLGAWSFIPDADPFRWY